MAQQKWIQCEAVYRLSGGRCDRASGHPGEHCRIKWDRSQGEMRLWWNDKTEYMKRGGDISAIQ